MRNFKGKHTHEQVFNHLCHVFLELELTALTDPDSQYFHPDVNVDPQGIISRESMTNYDHDQFTDWDYCFWQYNWNCIIAKHTFVMYDCIIANQILFVLRTV